MKVRILNEVSINQSILSTLLIEIANALSLPVNIDNNINYDLHHYNHEKEDMSIENLSLISHSEHSKHHWYYRNVKEDINQVREYESIIPIGKLILYRLQKESAKEDMLDEK